MYQSDTNIHNEILVILGQPQMRSLIPTVIILETVTEILSIQVIQLIIYDDQFTGLWSIEVLVLLLILMPVWQLFPWVIINSEMAGKPLDAEEITIIKEHEILLIILREKHKVV